MNFAHSAASEAAAGEYFTKLANCRTSALSKTRNSFFFGPCSTFEGVPTFTRHRSQA